MDDFYLLDQHMKTVLKKLCVLTKNGMDKEVEVSSPDYVEEELKLLQRYGYISLLNASNLCEWRYLVTMKYDGVHYNELEKVYKKEKRKENVRYWITTSISILALILSGISLYMSVCKGG